VVILSCSWLLHHQLKWMPLALSSVGQYVLGVCFEVLCYCLAHTWLEQICIFSV